MLNQPAPDFTLTASDGSVVSRRGLLGRYALFIFYPRNNTPVCDRQLDDFSRMTPAFEAAGVRVYGVNPASADRHQTYCSQKGLAFPVLSDPGASVARRFGTSWWKLPLNRRTVIVIDPQGNVCYRQSGTPAHRTFYGISWQNKGNPDAVGCRLRKVRSQSQIQPYKFTRLGNFFCEKWRATIH